jgi:hypothetical protein
MCQVLEKLLLIPAGGLCPTWSCKELISFFSPTLEKKNENEVFD